MQHVLTFQLTIPVGDIPEEDEQAFRNRTLRTQQAIADRIAAIPGVQSAGFSVFNDGLPMDGDGRQGGLCVEKNAQIECDNSAKELLSVSPDFFQALTTPLVAGRSFDWNDVHQQRPVVLLSENLARAHWGSATAALGRRVGSEEEGPWLEVIGVVKDIHQNGVNEPPPETVIYPAVPADTASFIIRSERIGTGSFMNEIRQTVWSVNQNLSPANVKTLGELYRRSTARTTMTLQLLTICGTMALTLGLIGIYGVVGYAISQRRREIGIRLAIGAEHRQIRRMFVRRALVLVGIGVGIGLAIALLFTRLMESQLFGISRLDPWTHAAIALLVVTAGAVASFVAARHASSFNPVEILKMP
jgi:predicted permease